MSQRTSTRFIILAASAAVIAAPAVMAQDKDYVPEKAANADALSERKAHARPKLQKRPERSDMRKARESFPGDTLDRKQSAEFPGDTLEAKRKKKEFPDSTFERKQTAFPDGHFEPEPKADYPDSVFRKDEPRTAKDPR